MRTIQAQALFLATLTFGGQTYGAAAGGGLSAPAPALKPCTSVTVDQATQVTLGKPTVIKLNLRATRMAVGGQAWNHPANPAASNDKNAPPTATQAADGMADVEIALLSPTDLFFLGKKAGAVPVVLQSLDGRCAIKDVVVTIDPNNLQSKLSELMPDEKNIKVKGAENTLVLSGQVSNALRLDEAMRIATSYGDSKKIVNLMSVSAPQQVMLEVKIAEVSKTLLDKFGIDFARLYTTADGATSRIVSGIIGGSKGVLGNFHPNTSASLNGVAQGVVAGGNAATAATLNTAGSGSTLLGIDAQKKDGLVRVLAEPNIMAISGQAASFLSGGKIFIPVAQTNNNNGGGTTITLEEKEFGVGLKFLPTVLDGTRVNLKLVSEASELSQTGSPFTTVNGVTSVLPSMTTRRVDTTVQLSDGQSFAIAGLISNNVTETIKRFPGLGEIPILGALFRSTEFQKDQTELLFIVTPRLVKPLTTPTTLPTENHVEPTREDVLFMGKAEGSAKAATSAAQP